MASNHHECTITYARLDADGWTLIINSHEGKKSLHGADIPTILANIKQTLNNMEADYKVNVSVAMHAHCVRGNA